VAANCIFDEDDTLHEASISICTAPALPMEFIDWIVDTYPEPVPWALTRRTDLPQSMYQKLCELDPDLTVECLLGNRVLDVEFFATLIESWRGEVSLFSDQVKHVIFGV